MIRFHQCNNFAVDSNTQSVIYIIGLVSKLDYMQLHNYDLLPNIYLFIYKSTYYFLSEKLGLSSRGVKCTSSVSSDCSGIAQPESDKCLAGGLGHRLMRKRKCYHRWCGKRITTQTARPLVQLDVDSCAGGHVPAHATAVGQTRRPVIVHAIASNCRILPCHCHRCRVGVRIMGPSG